VLCVAGCCALPFLLPFTSITVYPLLRRAKQSVEAVLVEVIDRTLFRIRE